MSDETYTIRIVEDGNGVRTLIEGFKGVADAADKAALREEAINKLIETQGKTAKKAASDTKYLADALKGLEQSNQGLSRAIASNTNGLKSLGSAASGVVSALAAFGLAVGVDKLRAASDEYTKMSNALRTVTTDQTKINGIMNESFNIAQKTGTSWSEVTGVYGKVSSALKAMGADQAQAGAITQTIAQSLQITGASGESAKAGLLQFQQALASGVLRGEEFNSVVEQIPGLAMAIAGGVKQSGAITIGELRKMAENGELTSKRVVEALQRVGKNIDILASSSAPTIEQGFTRVYNAFVKYIGEADKANGTSAMLANGLTILSQNMDKAVPFAVALGAALAFGMVANAITSMATLAATIMTTVVPAITAFTVALFRNPLLAAVGLLAIGAVIVTMKAFGVTIDDIAKKFGELADKMAGGIGLTKQQGDAAKAAQAGNAGLGQAAGAAADGVAKAGTAAATAAPQVAAQGTAAQGATAHIAAWQKTQGETAAAAKRASDSLTAQGKAWQEYTTQLVNIPAKTAPVVQSFNQIPAAATSAVTGIQQAQTVAGGVSKGFTDVAVSASAVPGAFTNVSTSAASASGGFQLLSMNANQSAEVVTRVGGLLPDVAANMNTVGTAATTAGAQLGTVGTTAVTATNGMFGLNTSATNASLGVSSLSTEVGNASINLNDSAGAFNAFANSTTTAADGADKASVGVNGFKAVIDPIPEKTASMTAWFQSATNAMSGMAGAAGDAEKSLQALQAKQAAAEAKSAQFAKTLKSVSASVNAYGEELKDIKTFLSDAKAVQDKYRASLETSMKALEAIAVAQRKANDAMYEASRAAGDAQQGLAYLNGQAVQMTENFQNNANAMIGYNSWLTQIGATARQTAGDLDTLARSNDNWSLSNKNAGAIGSNATATNQSGVTPGMFTQGGSVRSIVYNGKVVGDWPSTAASVANAPNIERLSNQMQAFVDGLPTGQNPRTVYETLVNMFSPGPMFTPPYGGFRTGGSFMVGGSGGPDSQHVAFRATPNERVSIETPAQVRKREAQLMGANDSGSRRLQPVIINTTIRSDDYDQYKRSKSQIDQEVMRRQARALRG